MAFNWVTFRTRAFTSLIFVAIMATGLLLGTWPFFILITIIHFGCWYEYLKLVEKIRNTSLHPYIKWGLALTGFHVLLFFAGKMQAGNYTLKDNFSFPFFVAGLILLVGGVFKQKHPSLKTMGAAALGWAYISISMGLFLHLRLTNYPVIKQQNELWGHENGFYIPVIIILAIWINDTMAYLVGSAIGKTPFSKISPKKTLEGCLGGMVLCVVSVTLLLQAFFNWQFLLSISLTAALFGTMGDLLESKIKRMASVKDSGYIMPGHGGFLDRFDSLLISVPVVALIFLLWQFL